MFFFFFFKQKTAYEMRISDWSSDVCSSDLHDLVVERASLGGGDRALRAFQRELIELCLGEAVLLGHHLGADELAELDVRITLQIGRASCRERVCQYV